MHTITTEKNTYKLICGMEIHAELKTASKMFCGCKNDPFGAPQPNIYTCPVCLGMPGGLPVANKKAIEWTLKVGLALGCKINLFSKFDRKNYFYPDLPKAYQISQYDLPFCYDGLVETSFGPVRITRIHLEEDTGKLQHTTLDGTKVSLIDYNRSSVPLMEIVSEPDIHSPEQAKEYAKKIRDILRYLDVADCDMDQGGMRLEANTSLAPLTMNTEAGELPNYKVEVKNINSFRFAAQAIEYEMKRQVRLLDEGTTPVQETRGFDSTTATTFSQRTKEDAQDYRYFPDPDLPPLVFSRENIEQIKYSLPRLPDQVALDWETTFQIEPKYTLLLVDSLATVELLETTFELFKKNKLEPNKLANALANKKLALSLGGEAKSETPVTPESILQAFQAVFAIDELPEAEIIAAINTVMAQNPDAVAKFQAGQQQIVGFFMGQTLRLVGKKIDTAALTTLIVQELKK